MCRAGGGGWCGGAGSCIPLTQPQLPRRNKAGMCPSEGDVETGPASPEDRGRDTRTHRQTERQTLPVPAGLSHSVKTGKGSQKPGPTCGRAHVDTHAACGGWQGEPQPLLKRLTEHPGPPGACALTCLPSAPSSCPVGWAGLGSGLALQGASRPGRGWLGRGWSCVLWVPQGCRPPPPSHPWPGHRTTCSLHLLDNAPQARMAAGPTVVSVRTFRPERLWKWCRLAPLARSPATGVSVRKALRSPAGKTLSLLASASSPQTGFEQSLWWGVTHTETGRNQGPLPFIPQRPWLCLHTRGPGCDCSLAEVGKQDQCR